MGLPQPKNRSGNNSIDKTLYGDIYSPFLYPYVWLHVHTCVYRVSPTRCLMHKLLWASRQEMNWKRSQDGWKTSWSTWQRVMSKDLKFNCQLVTTTWFVRVDTWSSTIQYLRNGLDDNSDCTLTKNGYFGWYQNWRRSARKNNHHIHQPAGRWGQGDLYKVEQR